MFQIPVTQIRFPSASFAAPDAAPRSLGSAASLLHLSLCVGACVRTLHQHLRRSNSVCERKKLLLISFRRSSRNNQPGYLFPSQQKPIQTARSLHPLSLSPRQHLSCQRQRQAHTGTRTVHAGGRDVCGRQPVARSPSQTLSRAPPVTHLPPTHSHGRWTPQAGRQAPVYAHPALTSI